MWVEGSVAPIYNNDGEEGALFILESLLGGERGAWQLCLHSLCRGPTQGQHATGPGGKGSGEGKTAPGLTLSLIPARFFSLDTPSSKLLPFHAWMSSGIPHCCPGNFFILLQ